MDAADKAVKTFHLFRHGETDWNRNGRLQGQSDIPLNDTGRAQARAIAERFAVNSASRRIDVILTSDLSRAYETAAIVAQERVPLVRRAGLRETNLGEAEGRTWEEVQSLFGEELAARWRSWLPGDIDVSFPRGETGTQVIERVFKTLEDFAKSTPYARIGVATHGGVIRRILQKLEPATNEHFLIPNGSLFEIRRDPRDGWSLCKRPL